MKYVANGDSPDSTSQVVITVSKSDDADKNGMADLTVLAKTLRFVDDGPATIWPHLPPQRNGESRGSDLPGYNPKRSFVIEVLEGDEPIANETVKIMTIFRLGTGGHGHVHGDTILPQAQQGTFYGQNKSGNPLLLETDANGRITIDSLLASQAAGQYLVVAKLVADTTVQDSVNLSVRVPDLVEFGAGNSWILTGTTSHDGQNHLSNHWCMPSMRDSLTSALDAFFDWTGTPEGGGSAIRLGVNDMSLETGGSFDIQGRWNFNSSHSFHRVGLSVDIDRSGMNSRQLDELTAIIANRGGVRYPERTIHYGFDGGH